MMTLHELVASVNVAGHGLRKLTQVYLRRRRPFILNHIITVRCNLRCPFCYISGPDQVAYNRKQFPRESEMNTDEMRAFYRQLVAEDFRLAVIVGGEPLIREDLDAMLGELRGHIFSTVFTNGLLLAERFELLRKATSIIVSLDAPDEEHDGLRAHKGLFRKAVEGIEAVRTRLPGGRAALMMTVTAFNMHRVKDMLRFAREMDLPVGFQPPTYEGQFGLDGRPTTDGSACVPRPDLATDAFHVVLEASRRHRVLASRAFHRHIISDRRSFACYYPAYVLGPVYPNGDVLGCTTATRIGNVRESGVRGITQGVAFRSNADAGPVCPCGCRDWGIFDISALHNHEMSLADLGRYYRAFVV